MNDPSENDSIDCNSEPENDTSKNNNEAVGDNKVDEHADEDADETRCVKGEVSSNEVSYCEICSEQFYSKKELRGHILVHVGQPRVILKRISSVKSIRKKATDTYCLGPERKGSLKLTLKKRQNSTDSLKLTLKKSSSSRDFTVVNSSVDLDSYCPNEVAGYRANDSHDAREREEGNQEPFEHVTIDDERRCEDNDEEKEEGGDGDTFQVPEKPSLDVNEGDSGVGSDTINAVEKEDENIDDPPSIDNLENFDSVRLEPEDAEESDALEATCRETIENLKKLREHSRSERDSSLRTNVDETTSAMIQELSDNPAISIISKSSAFTIEPSCPTAEERKESGQSAKSSSDFNWNQISDELSNRIEANRYDKDPNGGEQETETGDHVDPNTGALLRNFLIEHQRRNENESSLANNYPPGETEYVSLERLAETVSTCRVCNEKFNDITKLDEHKVEAGHFQCNIPDCSNFVFNSVHEVANHKRQMHGDPMSPSLSKLSPRVGNTSSPRGSNSPQLNRNSPLASPHTNTPQTYHSSRLKQQNQVQQHQSQQLQQLQSQTQSQSQSQQETSPPVNFDQLPAPVQQLAQQVQRMPLPIAQSQITPSLPPGVNTMIPAPNYFSPRVGRPPLYSVPATQPMHFPPHISQLYSPYGSPSFQQMPAGPQMMPQQVPQQMAQQMSHQLTRAKYPPGQYQPRPQRKGQIPSPVMRQRAKRPLQQLIPPHQQQQQHQQQHQQQQQQQHQSQSQQHHNSSAKQRRIEERMDVLMPDRNEDADCHIIAQQKRNEGVPVIQNVQGSVHVQQPGRNDSTIHLTDSITLSVRQPAHQSNASTPTGKKPDAKAVANVLAARGITVTPAANKNKSLEPNNKQGGQVQSRVQPASGTTSIPSNRIESQSPPSVQQSSNTTTLNLNSAISIIPASPQRKQQDQQGQFVVPQNRSNKSKNEVDRPPRPPTVDLTQDNIPSTPTPHVARRGRPSRAMLTCQVCDKMFQNQEILAQHMASHRTPTKLLYKCQLCPAQYPTIQALSQHKQVYHKEPENNLQNGGAELAIPVVDLSSHQVLARLSNLGIQSFIPLSQLSAQTGGYFGLPIITIDGARNPNSCNLAALGATSILSLGPLKQLPPR